MLIARLQASQIAIDLEENSYIEFWFFLRWQPNLMRDGIPNRDSLIFNAPLQFINLVAWNMKIGVITGLSRN